MIKEPLNIDPDLVFSLLEEQRKCGTLSKAVSNGSIKYQSSRAYPGYIERINEDDSIDIGRFQNGNFTPIKK